jgi:hypothetical protein
MEYVYLGDRNTDPTIKNTMCRAVRRADGKCIRGRNGSMLVELQNGQKLVVTGRLLRKCGVRRSGVRWEFKNEMPRTPDYSLLFFR